MSGRRAEPPQLLVSFGRMPRTKVQGVDIQQLLRVSYFVKHKSPLVRASKFSANRPIFNALHSVLPGLGLMSEGRATPLNMHALTRLGKLLNPFRLSLPKGLAPLCVVLQRLRRTAACST